MITTDLLRFQDRSKWRSLYERSKQNYWQPEAIDTQADKNQWLTMDKALKRKVMGLLQYAILLDSYQVKNLQEQGALTTDPMLGALLSFHSLMEAVHSQSYAYYSESVCTPKQRAWLYQQSEMSANRLYAYEQLYSVDHKLANYFLEGVSFQALFRLSDLLKEQGLLPGLSAILNLIKRDEDLHIETFQIQLQQQGVKPEWSIAFKAAIDYESNQVFEITEDEKLKDYVLYAGELRMKAIGLIDKVQLRNPLKHLEAFNDATKQNLKANFFTSNVSYQQKDNTLNWNEDDWFATPSQKP